MSLFIDIARTYYQMGRYVEAHDYYEKASAIDAEKAKEYSYIAEKAATGARAAEEHDPSNDIVFVEE